MRRKFNPQQNLFVTMAKSSIAKELVEMSKVLDATPKVLELVFADQLTST